MGHLERRYSGNIRSQLYQALPHSQCLDTLIKPFSFATCAVDMVCRHGLPGHCSSTLLFSSSSTTVPNFVKPFLTFQTDRIINLHEYVFCTRNSVYFAKFNTKLNIWPFCLQLLKQGFTTGKWDHFSLCYQQNLLQCLSTGIMWVSCTVPPCLFSRLPTPHLCLSLLLK